MCFGSVQAPEPIEIEKPVFVRNPFLDDEDTKARSADALRRGRSSLVIPTGTGIGFQGAGGSAAQAAGGAGGPSAGGRTIAGPTRPPRGSPSNPLPGDAAELPGDRGGN